MKDIKILGEYKFATIITICPDKKCIDCPFFEEGLCWCSYLKARVEDWNYNKGCPVKKITIEEE